MTDKTAKPKKSKKTAKAQPSVLGSLPATRPDRFGRREPASAAKPRTAAAKPRVAAAKPRATAAPKPRPATPPPPPPSDGRRRAAPPSGPALVTTAIQAVGEIAQIGVSVGGQVLKRAARRLPRP